MTKYFNIAGPCNADDHYIVPPLERIPGVLPLIGQKQYFIIHAARQTGKTTFLQHLVEYLNKEGKYYALYCSLESAQVFPEPKEGIPEILYNIRYALKYSNLPNRERFAENVNTGEISTLIKSAVTDYCNALDKPLVILFDEIDALQNGTLIAFLRQLREGYITRASIPFPHSVALVGMRNVRDYKAKIREDRQTLGSASPFNIITKAFTIANFSLDEIARLFQQHTDESGQVFEKSAMEKVLEYTGGQPWLVNAVAREIVSEILNNDYTRTVTPELVHQAAQNIMLRRDTHLDSLLERLKEYRVQKVIEPLIMGEQIDIDILADDTQYCMDLGLIKAENGKIMPANLIYNEVIIRALTYDMQFHLTSTVKNNWIMPGGKLDMNSLLKAFQQFWRENSEIWEEKYEYKEAAPHLILQAFLQRVVNGGGDILREYAGGRKRMDLCARYGSNQYPLELKIIYGEKTIPEGMQQLSAYMDKLGEPTGWLVVFDRDKSRTWQEKIFWKTKKQNGKTIHVVGC